MPRRHGGRLQRILAFIALASVLAGCMTATDRSQVEPSGRGPLSSGSLDRGKPDVASSVGPGAAARIGYISLGEQLWFARAVSDSVREAAARRDVEVVACDSRLELEGVRACARRLGGSGVAGVISFGAFPELGTEICDVLGEVPVVGVAYDQGPCQVSLAGTDNHAAGELAGDALGRFSRERWDCDISAWVSLESSAAGTLGAERMAGYRDGYGRHCDLPTDRVVVLDGTDRVVTAERQVGSLLKDLRGHRVLVVGLNEDAVSGALAAARQLKRGDDVWVSGQGADPSARWSIACDPQYVASVAYLPERFGQILVPTLLDAIDGIEVAPRIDTPVELVSAATIRALDPSIPPCAQSTETTSG